MNISLRKPRSTRSRRDARLGVRFAVPFLAAGLGACHPDTYRESADREVMEIIEAKQEEVLPREKAFTLAQVPLPIDEVGMAGEIEDLKSTPAPRPKIQYVDLDETDETDETGETEGDNGTPDGPDAESSGDATPEALPPDSAPREEGQPPASPGQSGPDEESGRARDREPARGGPVLITYQNTTDSDAGQSGDALPGDAPLAAGMSATSTKPGRILDLASVIKVSLANNRDYQREKENVYLGALSLTLARHDFAPRFFGILTGDLTRDGNDDVTGGATTDFGWNQLFASGARLSVSAFSNFLKFYTGNREEVANTLLNGTITQPLLRGFGSHIVQEPLTQAERNAVYEIRTFERFRKTFAVEVTSEYYNVLGLRNRVTNEYANWQDLVTSEERVSDFAEAGLSTPVQVDQARQEVLQARNRWIDAVESYESALDRLKITLGIPTDLPIGIDMGDLESLAEPDESLDEIELPEAIEAALSSRLDLMNVREQVEDAERQAEVAADGLRMQLDVSLSASIPSDSDGVQKPFKFDTRDGTYGAGFDVDLPFDRKAERNQYVASLVELDRRRRSYSLFIDDVRLTAREAYRQLQRQRQTYEIQKASVELARRRVESTSDLQRAGRVETRDVLESQSALIDALNSETSALINFTIARLVFHRDTGTMRVEENGTLTITR
jgi:outer membrane protein TolC